MPRSLLSPPVVTFSEFVLLALIHEKPRHGYELETEIETRGLRNWSPLGHSLVYHTLGRLKRRKWASPRSTPGLRGRPAIQYRLTAAGKRVLQQALEQALVEGSLDPVRTELALMFSKDMPASWFKDKIKKRKAKAQELRKTAKAEAKDALAAAKEIATAKGTLGAAKPTDYLYRYYDQMLGADIAWCDKVLKSSRR
ncbi:MAG: PadR family transcriptional regulator [Deltaproteobacteria bacterium]|nr:MAG: PadR family transcriptional regulator [Deltaproteobacteria bacterium]